MALLGNYNVFFKNPVTYLGGDGTSGVTGLRSNWNQPGTMRNRFYGENQTANVFSQSSLPHGYTAPYTWVLAPKAGGLGSNVGIQNSGALTANLAAGKNLESAIACSGDINSASLALVVSMIAAISASGTITNAALVSYLNMSASLAASGDLTGSLTALGKMIASMSGTGSMSPTMNATANMEADITPFTELSPESLAAAVWNAAAASFNSSGTMGNKLNGAGSAGDPWTTDLTSYTTEGTAGKILQDAKKKAATAAALSA